MEFLLHMEYFVYNGSTQCREKAKDGLWSRPFYSLDRQYLTCVCVHNYCHHLHYYYYYLFDSLDRPVCVCDCVSTIIVLIFVINNAAGTMSKTTEVIITIMITTMTI